MTPDVPYGRAARMLTLGQSCEWLNISERHARKLVARGAIPYRKIGHLLRFPEAEVERWSRPGSRQKGAEAHPGPAKVSATMGHSKIETTKNIYGHLFAQDRTTILEAMNQAVTRLHAYDDEPGANGGADAVA